MYIERAIKKRITEKLFKGKIIILYGPRQVGKTTLCKEILREYGENNYFSCDEPNVRDALSNKTSAELKNFLGGGKLIVIDEAQRVENIGLSLKLLVDNYPKTQFIATGSSSFELSNKINEPLTGRNFEFHLHPFALDELLQSKLVLDPARSIEERIIYGWYPEIIINPAERTDSLLKLANDSLYKDALKFQDIRKPDVIEKLLRLLALQIGCEVSMRELAQSLELSKETVESYIRLLEQAFVVFRLPPLAKNKRKEVTRLQKIYFYDVGLRNALIQNLNSADLRSDIGSLFENLAVVEVKKKIENNAFMKRMYFWRTKNQAEMDLVIEQAGHPLVAYECKWNRENNYPPKAWKLEFPDSLYSSITKDNLAEVLKTLNN